MDNARRKTLRQRAHALKPVLLVGDKGLTDGVLAELQRALDDHELVKVRLPAGDRDARKALATALVEATGAEQVQAIGRMLVLYRANPEARHPVT